ncbi:MULTISPECIES: type II secretion system protein [Cupriavidus]|jgi:general secretion pathway protein G|uniref:Type II secretion system protein G n=1 Tax=Cupriavidus metallidurans TaxID=119219 RepID=A0A2L0X1I3_9BURK|nr:MULTISPECIES: type II secretion system protein G [Cupriavidus]AVA33941.1 type II secretion system protein G [Cupriavidus metallidurans]KWR84012.1 type II secretion system protein G [Cupriavidus sp. SHE]QBP12720.1 type II secretion system protein G [Cupriavidus metallidurans]QWC90506.1 type II secretion system protein G [Cupriavidus metallidurans]
MTITMATARRRARFTLATLLAALIGIGLIALMATHLTTEAEPSQEAALRYNLLAMREAITRFHVDHGHYPPSLDTLVQRAYLHRIPQDPITHTADNWEIVPPPIDAQSPTMLEDRAIAGVFDVRSGALGVTHEGTPYREL